MAFPPQKTAIVYDVRQGMEKLISEYGLDKSTMFRSHFMQMNVLQT